MPQCHLQSQEGLLTLTRESFADGPLDSVDQEWLATELDTIALDLSPVSKSQKSLAHHRGVISSGARQTEWIKEALSRDPNQSSLCQRNGILCISKPQSPPVHVERFHEHRQAVTVAQGNAKDLLRTIAPELRLYIYRHLLVDNKKDVICFPICRNKKRYEGFRIVRLTHLAHWQLQHLHPQILQTCRLFNQEGTPILYGENMFRRSFEWPGFGKSLPFRDLFPLPTHITQLICRIRISRSYSHWFEPNSDSMTIFSEFPALRELQIEADLNDWERDTKAITSTRRAVELAARRSPQLKVLEVDIRLDFGAPEYRTWQEGLRNLRLDFRIHALKAADFVAWLPDRVHKNITWEFKTEISEYSGPSCHVKFTVDDTGADNSAKGIPCSMEDEYDVKVHTQHFNIV